MKTAQKIDDRKMPEVIVDPSLDKYEGKVFFPDKLAMAKEHLKNAKLPLNQKGK